MKLIAKFILSCFLMGGCSLFPEPGEAPKRHTLPVVTDFVSPKVKPSVLGVASPLVHTPLDTTRIMLRPNSGQIDYFADVEWAGRFDHLLQDALIYSLQNIKLHQTVTRVSDGLTFGSLLQINIRRFEIELTPEGVFSCVDLWAEHIAWPKRDVIATQAFRRCDFISKKLVVLDAINGLKASYLKTVKDLVIWLQA